MKDFRLFDITDFVLDEDFIRWVCEKQEQDQIFWENWLQRHPEKHLVVAEARRIVASLHTTQYVVPAAVITQEVDRLLQTISGQHAQPRPLPRPRRTGWHAAAALVLLLVATGVWYFSLRRPAPAAYSYASLTAKRQLLEQVNTGKMFMAITLPDGSTIELAPQSRIGYARDFDSAVNRDIYLSGEASFTVTRMPERPFRVFANDIVTKVLGTSFTIRSFEEDTTIQVTVRTGKVSVSTHTAGVVSRAITSKPGGEVILASNQRLVYARTAQKFQKILLEDPVVIVTNNADRNMVYDEAPLEKVFDALGKAYDISIVYDHDLLKDCTVTADLTNETFYRRLDLVCKAVGATYEVIDGQVVIQAAGCN